MTTEQPDSLLNSQDLVRATIARLSLFLKFEKKILAILLSYAMAIGVFALIVPLTVQELVNTFAYALQPIMIVTLTAVMVIALLLMGSFRVLQARAVEILVQRLYARIALGLTQQLPRFSEVGFAPKYANYFMEAELLPRSLAAMLVDIINVTVGGAIGMTILVMYHPYFLIFNVLLVGGFTAMIVILGRGGLKITMDVSRHNYATMNWLQDIANNLLHFKATASTPFLMKKTDEFVHAYVSARKTRSDILTGTQYKGSVIWQALGHSGLIATAGWLLAIGQITLGQFVAAEVIVGTLILNLDTVSKRMYYVYYAFTSLYELETLFSLPKDKERGKLCVPLPDPTVHGVRLTCKDVSFAYPNSPPIFQHFDVEVAPGEKVAVFSATSTGKTTLARVLAGLYAPTSGVIRYNGVDLRDLDMDSLNACRGLILDSQLTLFESTLEENITMGRPVHYDDIRWALRFVELEEDVDALPLGLRTPVQSGGKGFAISQTLRLLVARAIVMRPQILILDGTLHSMLPAMRETILRRLCSKEEPWSVIFVSNDPSLCAHVDRRIMLK
ncbi:MAG: ABC transporter ATP-binding protein [Nitrospirae bacterium]|nr:ABC transporter ATP-binding protein [Nitrospirota bacterium]